MIFWFENSPKYWIEDRKNGKYSTIHNKTGSWKFNKWSIFARANSGFYIIFQSLSKRRILQSCESSGMKLEIISGAEHSNSVSKQNVKCTAGTYFTKSFPTSDGEKPFRCQEMWKNNNKGSNNRNIKSYW